MARQTYRPTRLTQTGTRPGESQETAREAETPETQQMIRIILEGSQTEINRAIHVMARSRRFHVQKPWQAMKPLKRRGVPRAQAWQRVGYVTVAPLTGEQHENTVSE